MKLYEHEAAQIFGEMGLPVPERVVVYSPEEAKAAAEKIGAPVVIKAQVLAGSRGLAGGVKAAETPEEAFAVASRIIGMSIQGITVEKVLVTRKVSFQKELYMGITVDGYRGQPVVMVSSEGGMSIEEVARRFPEKIGTFHVPVSRGLMAFEARKLVKDAGFPASQIGACADIMVKLYQIFLRCNALIAEINPLVILQDGTLMAIDAKLEMDDSALKRLGKLVPKDHVRNETPMEKKGREIGVTYVELDGDIGMIASGAGLGMATMDIIGKKLRPANFLETGGGITEELLYKTMDLMMMKKGLRAIFINLYGGINPIHEGAKGIIRYIGEKGVKIPIVAKALGNRQEETWKILRSGGVHVVEEVSTEKAVAKLFEVLS
jgi:succinyl-CoA synthetase beta subunit